MGRLLLLIAALCCSAATENAPRLMTPQDLMALPVRSPDHVIRYGAAPSQFAELRLPKGRGPHPLVVLIHGGCWSAYAGASSIGPMADALKEEGIASWSIEFRRLPEQGSGWPGTYQDVATAIDRLRQIAPRHRLDLSKVVFLGHSAGAHLAHWAAGRGRLDRSSPLHAADPLKPVGIINLAGRLDMAEGIEAYERLCNGPVVTSLLGGTPKDVPTHYAEVSPMNLLPLGVPQVLIWGEHEEFVPAPQAQRFVAAARAAGDEVQLITVPDIGHFETASPRSTAWLTVRRAIRTLIDRAGKSAGSR